MSWMYSDYSASPDPQEEMFCPVCKQESRLGFKDPGKRFLGHCEDCKATYHFSANGKVLRAVLDSSQKRVCTCGRC